ncbi:Abscisic acid G-protein coupled receptor-domain-containing protein [Trichophaea hybrida]|nr:Abscisic acid G-protein coupled receptor-domain-containing protein [Trichophaea hybrida]
MVVEAPSMATPVAQKCSDDCVPHYGHDTSSTFPLLFASLPFILTFSFVSIIVLHRLFPVLCGTRHNLEGRNRKRLSAIAFSTTLGATAVLAELVLCEVSDWVDSNARKLAFRTVVSVLMFCLIVAIPLLEIYSLVETRWDRKRRAAVVMSAFGVWLWVFWKLPIMSGHMELRLTHPRTLSEECLARVGVVGVSLMALLSGFGCVSTPWQNFGAKQKTVSENDLTRASAGLEATSELLISKRNKLRYVEKKMQENPPQEGIMAKMFSAVRGDPDMQERTVLLKEVSGLESMRASLSVELAELQRRVAFQQRSGSIMGRMLKTIYWGFSIYCIYRIAATTLAHLPLIKRRHSSFSQSDPINNILAFLAVYWGPHLDRAAWSRQIGFLMSGVIIAGSLSSVMTTLKMLVRFAPGTIASEYHPNLPLFVSQLSAVYVLASAILLRSNLPPSMSTVISESLGAPLDPAFVDRWFDLLFLGAAGSTALTILMLRKVRGVWNKEADLESGSGTKES